MLRNTTALGLIAIFLLTALLAAACGQGAPTSGGPDKVLAINTTSLPDGQVGIVYSQTLKASGGSGTYTWSVSEGNLPGNFGLSTKTGSINGSSSSPGTFNFTVQVSDGTKTATQPLSITIKPSLMPLFIGNTYFDAGEVGIPYSRELSASGGSGAYNWSITEGSLPDGLAFDQKAGTISGTPLKNGDFYFTLRVTDSTGATRNSNLSITIKPYITVSTATLPDGKVGFGYDEMLEYAGGVGNVTWSISSGALPDGLTLDGSYGEIYGAPGTAGKFSFTVLARDSLGASATREISITITPE